MTNAGLINEEEADRILNSITDPIHRNLVELATAKARMRFMRPVDVSEAEFVAQLPDQPLDLGLFASLMKSLFANADILRRLLQGQSIEEASEWPI